MIHVLGIRHHGQGSGKMVLQRLGELQPDLIMIEGPPELDSILGYVGKPGLRPPVSIMLYDQKNVGSSTFYPYAEYSPEWLAAKFANENNTPVRSLDLPANVSFTTNFRKGQKPILKSKDVDEDGKPNPEERHYHKDALSYLAESAGHSTSEAWWESQFEVAAHGDAKEYFDAVMLAMSSLREAKLPSSLDAENTYREAYMRMLMRQAQNELFDTIVVICGAWHAPELINLDHHSKSDTKLIKQLPKPRNKINVSWIPWTNSRLSLHSGYGAGINSPGWYEHLWTQEDDVEVAWLTRVAELFRKEGQDISSAHVLESYRLAIALCQLRNKSTIGLDELNEAILTVMCTGDGILLELVKNELIVGDKIGEVPDDIPKVPLQEDFEKTLKSLRLRLSAAPKEVNLDLRQENGLKRSIFFHRLNMLNIPWAQPKIKRSKGTFKESWVLVWSPEMILGLIDNAYLGNTIVHAARKKVESICESETKISDVVTLLTKVLPANLIDSIDLLLTKIDDLSSISADIQDVMLALPNVIQIKRYGDVRKSDITLLGNIIDRLLTKVFINLPMACYGLDDDNSNKLFELISRLQGALKINDDDDLLHDWYDALSTVMDKGGVHPVIRGCVCRVLLDADRLSEEESTKQISFALSVGQNPFDVASWIEGFLRGSGMILIYDNRLWNLLYTWVSQLNEKQFLELLPYLRRSFSKFEYGERKQIGSKAKQGLSANIIERIEVVDFDEKSTGAIIETIAFLMGKS